MSTRGDVPPVFATNARNVKRAIVAYLEGDANLAWILGVIGDGGDPESARLFVDEMRGCGDPLRRDALLSRLEGWAT